MLPFVGHTKAVRCVSFSPDGQTLVSGGEDGLVLIWDVFTATVRHQLPSGLKSVNAVACHPDGKRFLAPWKYALAVLDSPDRIRFWDLETGKPSLVQDEDTSMWHRAELLAKGPELQEMIIDDAGHIADVQFLPDGESFVMLQQRDGAMNSYDKARQLQWRSSHRDGGVYPSWLDRRFHVAAMTMSRDGSAVAVASKVYVRLGRLDATWVSPAYPVAQPVVALALSANGKQLVGGWGSSVSLWDTSAMQELRVFDVHTAPVRTIAFSPEGNLVASAGQDGTVLLWEPNSGSVRARYDWHLGEIHSVRFSPDGLSVAVAGQGGLILFDVE